MRATLLLVLLILGGGNALAGNLFAGNRMYGITVSSGQVVVTKCGAYAVYTGPDHPAGPQLPMNLAQNGVFPVGSGSTILHSYHTGRSYHNLQNTGTCNSPLCVVAGPPEIETIVRDGVDVGFVQSWIIDDLNIDGIGTRIRFTQELVVEGPTDGSETIDNSVVRETHRVENIGDIGLLFSLKKRWDVKVGSNLAPWIGSCDEIGAACDRALNLTPLGTLSGKYPRNIVFNPSPTDVSCPEGIEPLESEGCTAPPKYLVVASVAATSDQLMPRPTRPHRLQYTVWNSLKPLFCESVDPLVDFAQCSEDPPNGSMQVIYHYSDRPGNGIRLRAGEERSFTQYLAAALPDRCPTILTGD